MEVVISLCMVVVFLAFVWIIIDVFVVEPYKKRHNKSRDLLKENSCFSCVDTKEEKLNFTKQQKEEKQYMEYPLINMYVIRNKMLPTSADFLSGKIIAQNGKYLTVKFGEEETKYEYPTCFLGDKMDEGGLRFGDPDLQTAFEEENLTFTESSVKLSALPVTTAPPVVPVTRVAPTLPRVQHTSSDFTLFSLDEALRAIERAVTPVWVRSSTLGDMETDQKLIWGKHYDTRGREIYDCGCKVFGWDSGLSGFFARVSPCMLSAVRPTEKVFGCYPITRVC